MEVNQQARLPVRELLRRSVEELAELDTTFPCIVWQLHLLEQPHSHGLQSVFRPGLQGRRKKFLATNVFMKLHVSVVLVQR